MKIGILSDTHGGYKETMMALEKMGDCERIFHLGDILYHGPRNDIPENYNPKELAKELAKRGNIYYIRGNCEADVDEMIMGKDLKSKERIFIANGRGIYMVHGYEETEEERIAKAKEIGCDIVISGHSHIKVLEEREGVIVINPGSTTIPKDGSKSYGIIDENFVRLYDLEKGKIVMEYQFKK
ncbi:MAG: phosphodiesterase [Tissierellia bacterium]|nr:phosphodiesterase [Tissierellia bacterium]